MYPELIKGFLCLPRTFQEEGREGFQRATAKPFGRARRRETLCRITQNDNMLSLSQTHQRNSMLFPNSSKDSLAYPELTKGKAAKVSKGRPQSPLVASAEAKPSVAYSGKHIWTEEHETSPTGSCSFQGKSNPSMYFSSGRKVPKAHRGGQFVHAGVATPDPRILIACARIARAPR